MIPGIDVSFFSIYVERIILWKKQHTGY